MGNRGVPEENQPDDSLPIPQLPPVYKSGVSRNTTSYAWTDALFSDFAVWFIKKVTDT